MQTFNPTHTRGARRLLAATLVLALAGALMQTVQAAPHGGAGELGGFGGPGMAMAHPAQVDRILASVGASAEQRSQITQIMQAAQTDLRAQREQAKSLHQQSQALFTQPSVDARAAEALRQQMLALHDQASKRLLQAMLDASRVLTLEQRQRLAERMNQRHSMMERQRAERDALDKATR